MLSMSSNVLVRIFAIAFVLALTSAVSAGRLRDNQRLAEIFHADQQERQTSPIDWTALEAKDQARRQEALRLLKTHKLRTANDYYHAAMLFQHGNELSEIRLAFSLAQMCVALDPNHKKALWLSAASWDRILMTKGVPQWYGTQYFQPRPGAPTELYKLDESVVSDVERAAMNVPSLQEAKDLLLQINR